MNVKLPNGKVLQDVPKGTTKYQALTMALQQGLITPEDIGQESYSPTGSFGENFLAGAGKAVMDLARGSQQLLNVGNQEQLQAKIDEAKRLDEPLMQTGGGIAGNVVGNVAAAAPTMFVPGANTVAGAALVGAGLGTMAPTASDENPLLAPAIGAAGGAAGTIGGRALEGLGRGVAGLVAPFTHGGMQTIAGRTLRRFATDPEAAIRAAQSYRPATPGVRPTLGEATLDPGLASAQKAIPDPALAGEIANQHAQNRDVLLGVLRDIAGTPEKRLDAVNARRAATEALYQPLENVTLPVDDELAELLGRPAVAAAYNTARQNALNRGQDLPPLEELLAVDEATGMYAGAIDGRTIQRLKQAIAADYQRDVAQGAIAGDTLDARRALQGDVTDYARQNLPGYADADDTFRSMSQPINEMDAGRYLYEKASPAFNEFSAGVNRVRPQALAQALRDGQERLPPQLRDIPGARRLSDLMSPASNQRVEGVMRDLAREGSAYDAPMVRGSDTMRNLASQNVMRQVLGPMGLPENFTEAIVAGGAGPTRALNLMLGGAEPNVQKLIVEAMRDPQLAARLMQETAGSPVGMLISDALRRGAGVPTAAASVPLLRQ